MDYQLIFRSKYGQLSAYAVLGFGVLFTAMIWSSDGFFEALRSLILPVGLAFFTWWIWAWPVVIADQRGIEVRNQILTYRVSWEEFVSAESRFGLYLTVKNAPSDSSKITSIGLDETDKSSKIPADEPTVLREADNPERRIFAAGVPARGGFTSTRGKGITPSPVLDFTRGPRVTVRTEPHLAARTLEEEKIYLESPKQRPDSHKAPVGKVEEWAQSNPAAGKTAYVGVTRTVNWAPIAIMLSLIAAAATYIALI